MKVLDNASKIKSLLETAGKLASTGYGRYTTIPRRILADVVKRRPLHVVISNQGSQLTISSVKSYTVQVFCPYT